MISKSSMIVNVAILFLCFGMAYPCYAKTLDNQDVIDNFYLEHGGEPLWVNNSKLNKSGKALFGVLKQSWKNGLNPDTYHVTQILDILDDTDRKGRLDEHQVMAIEILLTDGYVRYVRDLSGMRIRARDMELNPKHWRQRISAEQALSFLPEQKKNIADFLLMREPQGATYQRLKAMLVTLVEDKVFADKMHDPLVFKELVRPGYGYDAIPQLRARFKLKDVAHKDRYTYDSALVAAVTRFQQEQGLKPDGIIGRQTLHILNQGPLDKIRQIIVNMERLRWVSDEKPDRFIVVNIPSATLWAIDNGKVAFEMPVVVGRKERQTMSFITDIHGVRFNPTWTVPLTIKEEDILPKLIENPTYLADKGMELYDSFEENASTLDPMIIDWENIDKKELYNLRMVQTAGDHNPLGEIRILMPNEHNIYLHDTNHKEDFARSNRAKSSGCIRLKDPEKFALFALEQRQDWSDEDMQLILEGSETKDIYTPEKLAVYLLYYTTWLGDKNQIVYGSDIYDHDKTLLQLLEKLDGFAILGDNSSKFVGVVD